MQERKERIVEKEKELDELIKQRPSNAQLAMPASAVRFFFPNFLL